MKIRKLWERTTEATSQPYNVVSISCAADETPLCISLGILVAGVFFEIFLRDSVEGERGDGAFKERCSYSPSTGGAAPAAEIVAVDTNEAFIHVHLPFAGIVSLLHYRWGTTLWP